MPSRTSQPLPVVAGVPITHPQRVVFGDLGLTKLDLVRYYDLVAPFMLPHLRGRPLTLVQCAPDAAHCRYLRHSGERAPAHIRVVRIQERTKVGDYMVIDDEPGLIALAQRNIIEFHTWNARIEQVERPDRLVLDLDPGPLTPWTHVVEAARLVRATLQGIGLESWVKTTGGRGLHVVVPLAPAAQWSACLEFARAIAATLVDHDPTRYTMKFAKHGRERQILIDYLRNNRTNTSVAAYSVRARAAATVSMPLAWDELSGRIRPDKWSIRNASRWSKTRGNPWAGYFRKVQRLPSSRPRSVPH